jgi:hypothetical protein
MFALFLHLTISENGNCVFTLRPFLFLYLGLFSWVLQVGNGKRSRDGLPSFPFFASPTIGFNVTQNQVIETMLFRLL